MWERWGRRGLNQRPTTQSYPQNGRHIQEDDGVLFQKPHTRIDTYFRKEIVEVTTRNAGLAGQIEADLLAGSKSKTSTTHCRLCNGGMVYNGRDYCSDRCAQYATDGVPPHDPAFAKNDGPVEPHDGQ